MSTRFATFLLTAAAIVSSIAGLAQKSPDARDLPDKKKDRITSTLHGIYLPQAKSANAIELKDTHELISAGSGYALGYLPQGDGIHPIGTEEITENFLSLYGFRNSKSTHIVISGDAATVMDTVDGKPVIRERVYRNSQEDNRSVISADELYSAIAKGLTQRSRLDGMPPVDLTLMSATAKDDLPIIAKHMPVGTAGLILNGGRSGDKKHDMISAYKTDLFSVNDGRAFLEEQIYRFPVDSINEPLPKNGELIAFFVYNNDGKDNKIAAFDLRALARDYDANMTRMTQEVEELGFTDANSRSTYRKALNRRLDKKIPFDEMPADIQLSAMTFMLETMHQNDNFMSLLDQTVPVPVAKPAFTQAPTAKPLLKIN